MIVMDDEVRCGRGNPAKLRRPSQTDSEAFRRWFTDSKVVDAVGEPLVVYHGTQSDFDAFDPEMQGDTVYSGDIGFFFTNNPVEANAYATFDWDRENPIPNVMPVYLSIQNPLLIDIDNPNHPGKTPATWYDEYGQNMACYAEDCGHDGLIISAFDGGVRPPTSSVSGKETVYVVFKNTQIKSAIGNRGTFDPDNPDIRYSHGLNARDGVQVAFASDQIKFVHSNNGQFSPSNPVIYLSQAGRQDLKPQRYSMKEPDDEQPLIGEVRYRRNDDGLFDVAALDHGGEFCLFREDGTSIEKIERLAGSDVAMKMLKGDGRKSLDGDAWRMITVVHLASSAHAIPEFLNATGAYIFRVQGAVVPGVEVEASAIGPEQIQTNAIRHRG